MAIRLTKAAAARWNGNGLGSAPADWLVRGHEHISVTFFAGQWAARDERASSILMRRDTKAELLEDLTAILEN